MIRRTAGRLAVGTAILGGLVAVTAPAYAALTAGPPSQRLRAAATPAALAYVLEACDPCGAAVAPTPESRYPAGGTSTLPGIEAAPFHTGSPLTATTAGDDGAGTSSASAAVPSILVDLVGAQIQLTGVGANCRATPNGATGGATVAGRVTVGTQTLALPTDPGANTPLRISVGGTSIVGELNRQVTDPNGVLNVDAVKLTSIDGNPVDVFVGHAQCAGVPASVLHPLATPMVDPWVGGGATAAAGGVFLLRRRRYLTGSAQ